MAGPLGVIVARALFATSLVIVVGCGGDDGPTKQVDAAVQPQDMAASGTALTVKNYLAWCSVSVNGGAASSASQQVVNVQPGTINLVASPLSGFALGANMWH